jgi:hypothetical protein
MIYQLNYKKYLIKTAKILKPYIIDYQNSDHNGDYYFNFKDWTFDNLLDEKIKHSKQVKKLLELNNDKEDIIINMIEDIR